jgi:hypothetical protein
MPCTVNPVDVWFGEESCKHDSSEFVTRLGRVTPSFDSDNEFLMNMAL